MISVLIICNNREEGVYFSALCNQAMTVLGNEDLYSCIISDENWEQTNFKNIVLPDLLIAEACSLKALGRVKEIRRYFSNVTMLLISNSGISPEYYVNFEISPDLLLIKPYNPVKIQGVIHTFLSYFCIKREERKNANLLPVTSAGEIHYLDYRDIYYFEANAKKVILYNKGKEVIFNFSLHKLEQQLPVYFIRCHRSYIVNSLFIKKLDISNQSLYMKNEAVIPISKKYKGRLNISLKKYKI